MNKKRRMTILSVLVICLSLVLVAGVLPVLRATQTKSE